MLQRCMIHSRGSVKLAARLYSTHTLVRSGKVTTATLAKLYRQTTPISVVTAHDYPSALAANKANIDIILVGDSLAMVACGYDDTTQLSMEEMLFHCRSVKRGAKNAFLVADLPFGSFEVSPEQAMRSAIRLVQEGGMEAVKLEGGREMAETVRKITRHGISVMGHVGLLPQRQASLGGFKVQGKTAEGAEAVLQDALALQDAGCMSIVLEAIPAPVAEIVTQRLRIPTIGIGAGAACSGQVLVQMDMLGVFDRFVPRFCKQYDQLGGRTSEAITRYNEEVKARRFPAEEHTYPADSPALAAWVAKNKAS
ncbi:3-methyl-2-oxobutanoate hydroxymethyltransferase PanB [Protomyces lactucae-debilis]|uniref:3-methyl-2-oxobutanoate hydroxymethyltransferase n=1 Tax=Protomyces lactucae-debilis TaxID=2754530 RepID=A0A1Y2FDP7_PROLT|nr:3-methyl-2-oxobutanoate hydroxymethyltransferase PanB [Protomyces lactucae-debilis]ORY81544.1 3-methyl-2-oxobutanoate hydroxymethyltransferase PanB [Protomyces lactucae-debilis]